MEEPSHADADLSTLLATVRDEPDATAERPVSPRASPWLGEAAAVAEQATDPALGDAALRERVEHLDRLLDEATDLGDGTAERHVEATRTALAAARERLDAEP